MIIRNIKVKLRMELGKDLGFSFSTVETGMRDSSRRTNTMGREFFSGSMETGMRDN